MSHDPTRFFAEGLAALGPARVPYDQLLESYRAAFPGSQDAPDLRRRLVSLLETCVTRGFIALPKKKSAWQPGRPPLPKWVRVIRAKEEQPQRDPVTWLPKLGFAASLSDPRQREAAQQINAYLREHAPFDLLIPNRERSLQIFGDEKRLDHLADAHGHLFGGRLHLSDLGCLSVPLPLPYEVPDRGASGRPLLVIENHHTYWSFCQWNRSARHFSAIAYGSGSAFQSAAAHLDTIVERAGSEEILYFGDIDVRGLSIPCTVSRRRMQLGLVPLWPATGLYGWLLDHGTECPATGTQPTSNTATTVRHWLGDGLATRVVDLFERKMRIPQESLTLIVLSAMDPMRELRPALEPFPG